MKTIKVASYNIRKSVGTDRRRQPDRILRILTEIDADIVALQEVDRRFGTRIATLSPELIVDATQYMPVRYGIREASLGWHGNAILVRKGTEVVSQHRIELPAFEPRGAVLADVRFNGDVIRVVGMHLGLLGRWRERQARAVIEHLEQVDGEHPTVIMGDLNQWNIEGGCLDPFAIDHTVVAPGPSFHSRRPMLPLDRIILSRDFTVEAMGVHQSQLARTGSDHLPVWASLTLHAEQAAA
jgi:endonuclease/exonuclease/phosphatase family metal-dependent hydrolase